MGSNQKRQQTMAKRSREQAVRERRERKLAKKHAAAAERRAQSGDPQQVEGRGDDTTFGPIA